MVKSLRLAVALLTMCFAGIVNAQTTKEYTEDLVVSINDESTAPQATTVTVETLSNGNINFILKNFKLVSEDEAMYVGNIAVSDLSTTDEGYCKSFSYQGNILIEEGDDPDAPFWFGPMIGEVPLDMTGKMTDTDLYVTIDIDMQATLGQTIHVVLGEEITAPVAPELLTLTYNGTNILSASSVNAIYSKSNLKYTVSEGSTAELSYDESTSVLTIVVSNGTESKTYSYTFRTPNPAVTSCTVNGESDLSNILYDESTVSIFTNNETTYTKMSFDYTTAVLTIEAHGLYNTVNTFTYQFYLPQPALTSVTYNGEEIALEGYTTELAYEEDKITIVGNDDATVSSVYDADTKILTVTAAAPVHYEAQTKTYTFQFGDIPTGIASVNSEAKSSAVYDLSGRQIKNTIKGNVYIVNGKKVVK